MAKPRMMTLGGEGETARDALEALAFSLRDDEIAHEGMTITLRRAPIRRLGGDDDDTYAGFVAEVVRAGAR